MKKQKNLSLLEQLRTFSPTFSPPLSISPGQPYNGRLILHPVIEFTISATYYDQGYYAIRGTIALLDPSDGYLLQPSDDKIAEINQARREKGQKELISRHSFLSAAKYEIHIARGLFLQESTERTSNIDMNAQTVDYAKVVEAEALRLANKLLVEHEYLLSDRLTSNIAIERLPLSMLLQIFGAPYLNSRTNSDNQKKVYRNNIEKVATIIGLVPIGELTTKKVLKLAENNPNVTAQQLTEVQQFLDYVGLHRGVQNPLADIIPAVIQKRPKDKNTAALQRGAITPKLLPERVETKMNQSLLANFDPLAAGLVLVKEGRLSPEEVCNAKFALLDIDDNQPRRIFYMLRRDQFSGATHDYTFPLLPFGGHYMDQYISHLRDNFGPERLSADRYIISSDSEGKSKIDPQALKKYCRTQIEKDPFGYAALINSPMAHTPKAITMLFATFDNRLQEACRLNNDPGALLFMRHADLAQTVQADCYRAFTDTTGRDFLYSSVAHDQRGIPPTPYEKRKRSTKIVKDEDRKITNLPATHGSLATTVEVELQGIKAGDIVSIEVKNGCFVTVLPPN